MSQSVPLPTIAEDATDTIPQSWSRAVITSVSPSVDNGKWPAKRSQGDEVEVTAGVIADGHEILAVQLHYRHTSNESFHTLWMDNTGNDEYRASFVAEELGTYEFYIMAWLDRFATWQDQFRRRVEGGESEEILGAEIKAGADLLRQALPHAGEDSDLVEAHINALSRGREDVALESEVARLAREHTPPEDHAQSDVYELHVDPPLAGFGAWYEFFPRSTRDDGKHGTFDDAAERLANIKDMGFDVVYLPPIHPIGTTHRKGKDNATVAQPGDPGSPWAIGGKNEDGTLGGHKSIHPKLGGFPAFERFMERARELELEVSIDIAFQTSPDHPYVRDHPEWFYKRPDGSIRYAENPPKKYQDVYPLKFEGEEAKGLWLELKSVFEFWIDHGITTFRVDNPHTKPFAFWAWCLAELRKDCPELVVLSEAFTRPKTMNTLAKLGFNNSYTYFTWRNTRAELEEYGRQLFQTEMADFFRPNFWPNTPDILHDYLVHGGRPAHIVRFVLAATMSPVYGVYGPPFEHIDNQQHPDREEYSQNEKYEIRTWDWNDPTSLQPLMKRINRIRKSNPALQQLRGLRFHETGNSQLIAFSRKHRNNLMLVVANLDPYQTQAGQLQFSLNQFEIEHKGPFEVFDMLGGHRFNWEGDYHYIELNPQTMPAHIFRVDYAQRTEADHGNF